MTKHSRHGHTKNGMSSTYARWQSMVGRCSCPTASGYKNYGGRGITVCERWRVFGNFLADMGEAPDGMELERINNDEGYSPSNCRWATPSEQSRNRRSNRIISAFGKSQTLIAWSEETNIRRDTISRRLKLGWTPEQALTAAVRVSIDGHYRRVS